MDHATYCAELVRKFDYPRYLSVLYAPGDKREGLLAIYAFSLEVARIRELVSEALPGQMRLQWWRDALAGEGHGAVKDNPVAGALLKTIRAFDLPREPLLNLLDAREFDLFNDPMPDQETLEGYAGETSSSLIQLAALILDRSLSGTAFANACGHGGVAYAMVGLVRALPWHAARQQCFLPQDLLERHGVSMVQMHRGEMTPELGAALREVLVQAQMHYDKAISAMASVSIEAGAAFLPVMLVPKQIDRLSREHMNYLQPLVSEGPLRSHVSMWRAARRLRSVMQPS